MKNFLLKSKDITKAGAFWNMVSSILSAFQSVILLVVLSHTVGDELAGIYTMGNVSANLFVNIGKYGMRGYQVSDVGNKFSFREYHISRIYSTILMAFIALFYTLWSAATVGYSGEKTWIILLMCIMKLADSYEDVFFGDYQKSGRLDVGSKCLAARIFITIVVFAFIVIATKNLLLSLVISTILTSVLMLYFLHITKEIISDGANGGNTGHIRSIEIIGSLRLLWVTLPLCLSMFLINYIGAAPKNSIDRFLDSRSQAIYGYISMPVFVVSLLAGVVFNPVLRRLSFVWNERDYGGFIKEILRQVLYVIVITTICILGAWLIGIPILSLMYNIDLSEYKSHLLWLLFGGGFYAIASLFTNVLTIMRRQRLILAGYAVISAGAFLLSDKIVKLKGISGAVQIYVILLIALAFFFAAVMIMEMVRSLRYDK